MSFSGLRDSVQFAKNRKNDNEFKKNSGGAGWRKLWQPPKLDDDLYGALLPNEQKIAISEPVLFCAGSYLDEYTLYEQQKEIILAGHHGKRHTISVKRRTRTGQEYDRYIDISCSAGPDKSKKGNCVGCWLVANKGAKSYARDFWAFAAIHLVPYHKVPYIKDNKPVTKDDGTPIFIDEQCTNPQLNKRSEIAFRADSKKDLSKQRPSYRECDWCKQGCEMVFGSMKIIDVGINHLQNIFSFEDSLNSTCGNCNTYVKTDEFFCPKCDTTIRIPEEHFMNLNDIREFPKLETQCPGCNETVLPQVYDACGYNDAYQAVKEPCGDTKRMSIFDNTVVWLQKEGEKKDSKIVVKHYQKLQDFKAPQGVFLAETLEEFNKKPLDLKKALSPQDTATQARILDMADPFTQAAQSAQVTVVQRPANVGPPQFSRR